MALEEDLFQVLLGPRRKLRLRPRYFRQLLAGKSRKPGGMTSAEELGKKRRREFSAGNLKPTPTTFRVAACPTPGPVSSRGLQRAISPILLYIRDFICDRTEPRAGHLPLHTQLPTPHRSITERSAAETDTSQGRQTVNETGQASTFTMSEGDTTRTDSSAKDSMRTPPTSKPANPAAGTNTSPKKRRKVNHGKPHALCKDDGCGFFCLTTLLTHGCSMRLLPAIGKPYSLGLLDSFACYDLFASYSFYYCLYLNYEDSY